MALYRQVHCAFWCDDTDILETFSPEDKYFYLYLLTNPHTTQCGIYEISVKHMILETGYNQETIEKLITRFETTYKKIKYNRATKELAIKNWLKYNNINSPKVQICVERELAKIKDKSLISFTDTVSIVYEEGITKKKKKKNIIEEEEDRVKAVENNLPRFRDKKNNERWKKYEPAIKTVILYYNTLRKRKLNPASENYVKLLGILFEYGYTKKQCEIVIKYQWVEWGDDEKMYKYHRPETLFAYENFLKYLPDAEEWYEAQEKRKQYQNKQLEDTKKRIKQNEEYIDPELAKMKIGEIMKTINK